MMITKTYDLVILGATGFTGQLAAEYAHRHYGKATKKPVKFALAGRSLSKLQAVRTQLTDRTGIDASDVPLVVVDAVHHPQALDDLCASTVVLANYAGTPFLDKALPVVQACVKHGTHYTDITGEVPLHKLSYDQFHQEALKTKSCIVHSCGYDSVPSELGAFLAAEAMQERHGCKCKSIRLVAGDAKGSFSGGTIHTGLAMFFGEQSKTIDKTALNDCYALDPPGGQRGPDISNTVSNCVYDDIAKTYVVPFVMASANSPVVRKTNALLGYKYGLQCSYSEVQAVPNYWVGMGGLLGFGLFAALLALPPTRYLLTRFVLPSPGQGPSRELQESGYFKSTIYATGDTPEKPVTVAVIKSGNAGDPGYKATARMSIEASLCLALQRQDCHPDGGVLTPASAMGNALVNRLNGTGMQLFVEP